MQCTDVNDLAGAKTGASIEPVIFAELVDLDSFLVVRHEGNAQAQRCITISGGMYCIAVPAARSKVSRAVLEAMASVAEANVAGLLGALRCASDNSRDCATTRVVLYRRWRLD